jgi:tetratricopeptide (TPR) repeat protein
VHLQQALSLCRQIGDRATEAEVLTAFGLVSGQRGEPGPAVAHFQQALGLCRQFGYRATEADALNGLGEALRTSRSMHDSRIQHTHALAAAIEIGNRDAQARAHNGIAATHQAGGDLDLARQHWQTALTLYHGLDLPDAGSVRAKLNQLATSSPLADLASGHLAAGAEHRHADRRGATDNEKTRTTVTPGHDARSAM